MHDEGHSDLFAHLKDERFSVQEAAEFLEVSMPAFRRSVQSGELVAVEIVGSSQLFSSCDLRNFKKQFYRPSLH